MHLLLAATLLVGPQDTTRWAPVARILDDAIAARAFPGAVVAVGRRDTILYLRAFGHQDYEHGVPVTPKTVWDVASLTKVVGLTTALMMLVDEGKVGLDTPAVRYVPAFHPAITVRQLLTHSSGLPGWKPYWQRVRTRRDMFAAVNAEPLEQEPGIRMVYSDLGAMVLTQVAEVAAGSRIDRFLAGRLFGPLGMRDTRYLPPRSWLRRIPPTERDTTWRHRLVHGTVHDENTAAMGGISGHAGLFSTAPDLVRFAQLMLRCFPDARRTTHGPSVARGTTHDAPIVNCTTVQEFTRTQDPGFSTRALGWDTPPGLNDNAGTRLSPRAYGHTGFTGTSMWIDPQQDVFVILLTNRVYPTRENPRIFRIRPALVDAAVAAAAVDR